MTTELEKPANASAGVTTPLIVKANKDPIAIKSERYFP